MEMELDILYSSDPVPYRDAHAVQKTLHERRAAGSIPDTLWLLEHPPVITIGIRRNQDANLLIDPSAVGAELVETERGGEITYHGPGQLVGYLFVSIENHGFKVKNFVRKLEDGFIDYLNSRHGISASHDPVHTGVWVGSDKITAIGIALRKRVTLHGFAFNINTNLDHFNWIVPCGISDSARGVTSLQRLTDTAHPMSRVAAELAPALRRSLGYAPGPAPAPFSL